MKTIAKKFKYVITLCYDVNFSRNHSSSAGGNSNTGQSARKFFFTPEIRNRVISWLPERFQEMFRMFFSNLSVILRLMSSDKPIHNDIGTCLQAIQSLKGSVGEKYQTSLMDGSPQNVHKLKQKILKWQISFRKCDIEALSY